MAADVQFTFIKQKLPLQFYSNTALGCSAKVNLWNSFILHQIADSHCFFLLVVRLKPASIIGSWDTIAHHNCSEDCAILFNMSLPENREATCFFFRIVMVRHKPRRREQVVTMLKNRYLYL
jgi:hypothetical protein